jgi:hypothetical protein
MSEFSVGMKNITDLEMSIFRFFLKGLNNNLSETETPLGSPVN